MTDRPASMLQRINEADDESRREVAAGDANARVGQIIQTAHADLIRVGLEPEAAASLLASAFLMRIPSVEARRALLCHIDHKRWPYPEALAHGVTGDDDDDGEPA